MSLIVPTSITEAGRSNWYAIPLVITPLVAQLILMYQLYFMPEVYIRLIPVALFFGVLVAPILFKRAAAPGMGFHDKNLRFFHKFVVWSGGAFIIYGWSLIAYGLPLLMPSYVLQTKEFHVQTLRTCNSKCYWCDQYIQLADWVGSPAAEFCIPRNLSVPLKKGDRVKVDGYFSNSAIFVTALRDGRD